MFDSFTPAMLDLFATSTVETLIMVGIGLITMNAWFLIIATGTVIFTTFFAVRAEELHLHARFGFEFERYCRSTSRWI